MSKTTEDQKHAAASWAMDLFHSPMFSIHIQHLMHQYHTPGLAIALVHNQSTASRAFGQATINPPRPCTTDSLFDIASSSKSLTAASVALMVEDDDNYPNVKWDAKMCNILPEDFVMAQEEYTNGVTVEVRF